MKKSTYIVIVALLLVAAIAVAFSAMKSRQEVSLRDEIIEEVEERPEITINTKHQYKDGEHVFVGTLELPTPCHAHTAEIIPGDKPEIRLTTTAPEGEMVCAQVITEKTFKLTYTSGEEEIEFTAMLNGERVNLNIFEISPEDDIDTLELFLKG